MIRRLLLLLIINFGALAIGSFFTGKGVPSDWYMNLSKAPWTPPGWVFGSAWSLIMVCFSIYLAYLWPIVPNKKRLLLLFTLQWILNVSWNPTFFHFHNVIAGMIIISALTILVGYLLITYSRVLKWKSTLLLPYLIWLLIASSLNGYILVFN